MGLNIPTLPMRGLSAPPSEGPSRSQDGAATLRLQQQEPSGNADGPASDGTSTASSSIVDDDEYNEDEHLSTAPPPMPTLKPTSGFKLALPPRKTPPDPIQCPHWPCPSLGPHPSPAQETSHPPTNNSIAGPPRPPPSTHPSQRCHMPTSQHHDSLHNTSGSGAPASDRIVVELISQAFCIHLGSVTSPSFVSLQQSSKQQQQQPPQTSRSNTPDPHPLPPHQQQHDSTDEADMHSKLQQLSLLPLPSVEKESHPNTTPAPAGSHPSSHRSTIASRCSSSLGVSPSELSFYELRALAPGEELPSSCRHVGVMVDRSGFSLSAIEDLLLQKRNGEQLGVLLAAEQQLVQQAHAQAVLQTTRASEQEAAAAKLQERCRTLEQENASLRHQLQKGDAQYTQMYHVISTLRHEFLELKQDIVGAASPAGPLQQPSPQRQQLQLSARGQHPSPGRSIPESTP
ncbi:MAG: hypothetical protein WDW38_007053 [Sanguina aurantia]